MPIIFSTSSLALPGTLARFTGVNFLKKAAIGLNPGGTLILNFLSCLCASKTIFVNVDFELFELIFGKWVIFRSTILANEHFDDSILQLLLHLSAIGPRWCQRAVEEARGFHPPHPTWKKYRSFYKNGNTLIYVRVIADDAQTFKKFIIFFNPIYRFWAEYLFWVLRFWRFLLLALLWSNKLHTLRLSEDLPVPLFSFLLVVQLILLEKFRLRSFPRNTRLLSFMTTTSIDSVVQNRWYRIR